MKNEEKLYLAIGEIDESLIKEASAPYKPRLHSVYKGLAIAASVAVISVVTVLGGIFKDTSKGDGDMNSAPTTSPEGEFDEALEDSVSHKDKISDIVLEDELKVSFRLTITDEGNPPVELTVIGKIINGDSSSEYAICTTGDNKSGFKIALSPSYTVNGIPTDKIPTEAGEYDITVDFSIIKNYDVLWEDFVFIEGKNRFKIK
jgi:hypothetical protein